MASKACISWATLVEVQAFQCRLDDRLIGARPAAESELQSSIRAQAGVDFREAVGAGEDRDQGVFYLFQGGVLDRLLRNTNLMPLLTEKLMSKSRRLRLLIPLIPSLAVGSLSFP